jgi:glycosyltransferase involved in cell wall biosynthesis
MSIGMTGVLVAKIVDVKCVQTYHTYLPDFSTYLNPTKLLGIEKIKDKVSTSQIAKNIKGTGFYQRVRELNRRAKKELLEILPNKKIRLNLADRSVWSFTRALYNQSDLVLTPSEVLAKLLRKHGIKPPVLAQTNGIQSKDILVRRDYKSTGKILHFGRLGLEKDIDVVIKAFELVNQKDRSYTLHIIGDGPARESLENLTSRLVLKDKIKFYGFVPHDQVVKKLKDYDLFVTASPMETQGLVILEAMAAGLPVVGVDMLAVPEVVHNSINGYVVPKGNYKKMSKKIIEIMSDEQKRQKMGKESIEIASRHEIGHAYQLLLEKYKGLLGR